MIFVFLDGARLGDNGDSGKSTWVKLEASGNGEEGQRKLHLYCCALRPYPYSESFERVLRLVAQVLFFLRYTVGIHTNVASPVVTIQ